MPLYVTLARKHDVPSSVSEVLFVMFTSTLMVFTLASNIFVIYAVRNHPARTHSLVQAVKPI